MPRLEEGAQFNSYHEFQSVLAKFCRQTNSRFVVHDCKGIERFNTGKLLRDRLPLFLKYKYAKIACERFGQPRHEGRGIRNKGSKKNGCGAHVTITARRTKQGCSVLCIMRCVTKHSNQCEIRRKQKRIMKGLRVPPHKGAQKKRDERPKITGPRITVEVPGHNFQVRPDLLADYSDDSDNSMQEYNYDVKPMVVYSDDEEEQKPIPIYHLNENETISARAESTEPTEPAALVVSVKQEPMEPAEQVEAVEPEELVVPVELPEEPVEPAELLEPAETEELLEPAESAEHNKHAETVELLEPEESTEPMKPVECAELPKPAETTETVEPAELTARAASSESAEPTQPSNVDEDKSSNEDVKPVLPLLPEMPEMPEFPKLPESEDVKPLPLTNKPSLRALLLPAMALNFSQRAIHSET